MTGFPLAALSWRAHPELPQNGAVQLPNGSGTTSERFAIPCCIPIVKGQIVANIKIALGGDIDDAA